MPSFLLERRRLFRGRHPGTLSMNQGAAAHTAPRPRKQGETGPTARPAAG
jgi:hypothetical protein